MNKTKLCIALLSVFFLMSCGQNNELSKTKKYISLLKEKGLYKQAADELRLKSEQVGLSEKEKTGMILELGDVYREDLKDYESALGVYYKARLEAADASLWRDLTERIIDCLEKTGKIAETAKEKAALDTAVFVPAAIPISTPKTGALATVNGRAITKAQLEDFVSTAPAYIQVNFKNDAKKMEVLQQFLSQEVFYEVAKRQKLDQDPLVSQKLESIKKNMMIQRLMEKEGNLGEPTEADLKIYYDTHPESFKKKDAGGKDAIEPFQEAKEFIKAVYGYDRQKNAFNSLLQKYMKTEKVVIFEEELKKK